jgi:hypothetical protein
MIVDRRRRPFAHLLLAATLAAPARPVLAGGSPVPSALPWSAQRQVNVETAGHQERPDVVARDGGGWTAVWEDAESGRIVARNLARDGTPESAERTVVSGPVRDPAIARLDDGRLVVAWLSEPPPLSLGLTNGIQARLLSSAGLPTGAVFDVAPLTVPPWNVDAAADDGGGFVVAWGTGGARDIGLRRFDANATPLEAPRDANTLDGEQIWVRICRLAGGRGHLLVWASDTSNGNDASDWSVQWRRLDAAGLFDGPEAQANAVVLGTQYLPDVAPTPDGGFALVWESIPGPGADDGPDPLGLVDGIALRIFDREGVATVAEQTVSAAGGGQAVLPSIETGARGDLFLSWTTGGTEITGLRHAPWPQGAFGGEFQVDDFADSQVPVFVRLAADERGDYALVWQAQGDSPGGDDDGRSVQMRPMTPGRVAAWGFEEGSGPLAEDAAGLVADDAVLGAGDPVWSWGPPGLGALEFLGAGFANVSPSVDLALSDPGVTIAAWIYLETPPSALPEAFASIYDAVEDNYVLYLDRNEAELRFKVTLANGATARPGIAEGDLPLRQWIHVAGVYAGDGAARIFLDGVERDVHPAANLVGPVRSVPAQVAALGRNGVGASGYFDGRVDALSVWRRGLTPAEIVLLRGPLLFADGFERGDVLSWSTVVGLDRPLG